MCGVSGRRMQGGRTLQLLLRVPEERGRGVPPALPPTASVTVTAACSRKAAQGQRLRGLRTLEKAEGGQSMKPPSLGASRPGPQWAASLQLSTAEVTPPPQAGAPGLQKTLGEARPLTWQM